MPSVKFVKEKKTVEVPEGANLRRTALKSGVELYPGIHKVLNCHGFGHCGSCRVYVTKGKENVSKQGLFERLRFFLGPILFFTRIGHEDELRLACRTRIEGDVEIETQPSMNLHGEKFWG